MVDPYRAGRQFERMFPLSRRQVELPTSSRGVLVATVVYNWGDDSVRIESNKETSQPPDPST